MPPTASSNAASAPVEVTQHSIEIEVRQYRAEDLPQVVELFKAGMLAYPAHKDSAQLEEYIANSLRTDLADIEGTYMTPGGNFWVATPKSEPSLVVGMVGLEAKPEREGELRRMSVKESHRRYGIGRLLISALERWAIEQNYKKVWLTTGGVMDKARGFYKSTGYREVEIIVVRAEPRFEVVKIEKELPTAAAA